jgi:hypothetical protein
MTSCVRNADFARKHSLITILRRSLLAPGANRQRWIDLFLRLFGDGPTATEGFDAGRI